MEKEQKFSKVLGLLALGILLLCISFLALIDDKYNLKTYFAIYTFSSVVSLMFLLFYLDIKVNTIVL